MYHHYLTVLSPSHHLNLCQAINREMAPEYTDDQEEGEHVHHSQTQRVLNYRITITVYKFPVNLFFPSPFSRGYNHPHSLTLICCA